MGLSGRRRARKEGSRSQTSRDVCTDPVDPADIHDRHRLHRSSNKRTGNTYRRALPKHAADLRRADLLQFDVSRGFRDDVLMPPRPQPGPQELNALPNENRYNSNMVRIGGNDYDASIVYSLKKRNRWTLARSLKDNYDSCEELKSQNVFLIESVARGSKSKTGAVKSLTTNALYTRDAAKELRDHEKELGAKHQPKLQVQENDRFKFSERIVQEKTDRPLKKIGTANQKSSINQRSVRHECNLWNHLYNVSPSAENERMDLQRDYDNRITVTVATSVPCPGVDAKRLRRAEKENHFERLERLSKQNGVCDSRRKHDRSLAKRMQSDMELQLEMDGSNEDIEETVVVRESKAAPFQRPREVALLDAMTVELGGVSLNRAKRLAKKAHKLKKAEATKQRDSCKQRNNSDLTAVSSGYDSGCESRSEDETMVELVAEKESVDIRLAETVAAALAVGRPVVQVPRDISDSRRLSELFGANCSTEQALVIGNSEPKKLAILLQADLSESVVFEEVAQRDPQFVSYAINHLCNKVQVPKTSLQEVATQADPFAFLCSLVSGQSDAAQVARLADTAISDYATASASWRHAAVLTEADARVTALRSLPMFSAAAAIDSDAELVSNAECEICCRQLDTDPEYAASRSFAEGSTMLRECGHQFCNGCWLHHVASCVAQGRVKITCPGYKCQSALDAATLLWFCPPELLSALTSAAFSGWLTERRKGRRVIQRRFCPRAGCGRLLECRGGVNAVCGACQLGLCLGCGQEPHWPADCAMAAKYRNKMQSNGHVKLAELDFNATIDVNAKQCPACQTLMEKGMGCNHMTCRCGEHFCWWCGQSMRTHTTGPCVNEASNRRTQSGYRVQREFTARDSFLTPNSQQSRMYCAAVRVRWHRETSPMRLASTRQKILGMFQSYTLRFHNGDCSWPDVKREAMLAVQQLIDATDQASYLVEHSFAHLDGNCGGTDRCAGVFVRAIGGQISHLVETLTAQVQEQCRMGYQGPRKTKLACDRVFMMLRCLRIKCRMLNSVVVNHRDRRQLFNNKTAKKIN